ncbi:MAG: pantetheine-phosphate adenylyltransferase [Gammaproteobacteria bacterium]|nr:pantetheine-phosphate adenylyltransferase [Gammaproteobacteria bacterium]
MKQKAVYAGTFDPVTFGHIDLVERATRIFDQIIIAIAGNENKKPLFTVEERVKLCEDAFCHLPSVTVMGFNSLLLDFAREHDAQVILRGLRTVTDFDYEFQLASMNRFMNPTIESIFLMPAEKYMYISSTLVREIAALHGDVQGFVPKKVVEALNKKYKPEG